MHADRPVRTAFLAGPSTDACRIVDVHRTVARAPNTVRRTVVHAVRLLAVPAGINDMYRAEGRTVLPAHPRDPPVRVRAGPFAIVAADAERLIDHERIHRLAHALLDHHAHPA